MRTTRVRSFSPLIALLLLFVPQSVGQPISVRVTHLHDDRLPKLSTDRVDRVLKTAAAMIERAYGKQVTFTVVTTRPFGEYVAEQRRRIAPYRRPKAETFDIYFDLLAPYRERVADACRVYGTVDQLRALLDPDERASVTSLASAADALLLRYRSRLDGFHSLKDAQGRPLITPQTWAEWAITEWDVFGDSAGPKHDYHLVLANVLLIDNDMRSPAPHSIASGFAYGVTYPASNEAIVAYLPMLSDDPAITTLRLGQLTDDERDACIAYVIGHEVGTHAIMNLADSYDLRSLLALPIRLRTDKREILDFAGWKPGEPAARPLPMDNYRARMREIRIDIALAKKDITAAMDEHAALSSLKIDPRWLEAITRRIEQAYAE